MFNYLRKAGTTDVSVVIRIIDSTDGTPETGVVWNTAGIDLEYRREGATSTNITEATLAGLDSAHADGGFLHIGNGYYRLDLPDAACAAGVAGVLVHGTVTGMVVIGCYVQLVTFDPFDTVRLGLTALPNAAANAAGGLPISAGGALALDTKLANTDQITVARMGALTDWIDGGRLDLILDGILADTGELQTDWVNGGRLDLLLDGVKTKTDYLPSVAAGGAGGVFIAGANAATSITTALTANLTGNITGNLSGTVGSVTGAVGSVTGAVGSVAAGGIANASFNADVGSTAYATNIIALAVRKVLDILNLDHLAAVATAGADMTVEVVDNSILARILGNGDTSAFDPATMGLEAIRAKETDIETDTAVIGALGAGLTAIPWNANWDAEVQSECADALAVYDPPTKAELDTAQGAVTVAAIGANVITAASLNADAGTEIAAAVMAKTGAITSLSIELLIERLYEMVNNKMIVTEATGAVALRNLADGADVATGNVQDLGATTVRAGLTWV